MAYVGIHLAYYKQGDDLQSCLDDAKSPESAFRLHAEMLRGDADHLDRIADMIGDEEVVVEAGTHMIAIECSEGLAQRLVEADLATIPEEFQEDEEGDDLEGVVEGPEEELVDE